MATIPLKGSTVTANIDGAGAATLTGVVSIDQIGNYTADQMIDITLLASTCVKTLGVMPNYGDLVITFNLDYTDTVHAAILGAVGNAKENNTFAVTLPDSGTTTVSVTGPIASCPPSGGDRGTLLRATVTVHINAAPTIS